MKEDLNRKSSIGVIGAGGPNCKVSCEPKLSDPDSDSPSDSITAP